MYLVQQDLAPVAVAVAHVAGPKQGPLGACKHGRALSCQGPANKEGRPVALMLWAYAARSTNLCCEILISPCCLTSISPCIHARKCEGACAVPCTEHEGQLAWPGQEAGRASRHGEVDFGASFVRSLETSSGD